MNTRKFVYLITIALGLTTAAVLIYARGFPPPNGSTLRQLNDAERGGLCLAESALTVLASFAEHQTCAGARGKYPIEVSVDPGGNGKAVIDHTSLANQLVAVREGATCSTKGGGSLRAVPVKYTGKQTWNSGGTSFLTQADNEIDDDLLGAKGIVFDAIPPPPLRRCPSVRPPPGPPCVGARGDGREFITQNDFPLSNWSEQWEYLLLTATDSELSMTRESTLPDTKCRITLKVKGVNNSHGLKFSGVVTVMPEKQ